MNFFKQHWDNKNNYSRRVDGVITKHVCGMLYKVQHDGLVQELVLPVHVVHVLFELRGARATQPAREIQTL